MEKKEKKLTIGEINSVAAVMHLEKEISEINKNIAEFEEKLAEIYDYYLFEDNDYAEDDIAIEAVMNALTEVTYALYELKAKYFNLEN